MSLILNHMVQYEAVLDQTFAAVADPTRRRILERLGQDDATISELAMACRMTLTGLKKHVRILEAAGLVASEKIGRVRICRVGSHRLADEAIWIDRYRETLADRLDRPPAFPERTKAKSP